MSSPNFRQLLRVAAFTMLLGLMAVLLSRPATASRDISMVENATSSSGLVADNSAKDSARNDLSAAPIEARASFGKSRTSPLDVWLVDDGSAEAAVGWGNSQENRTSAAIWLNRFIPASTSFPLRVNTISVLWPGVDVGNFVGREVRILVYVDQNRDGNPADAVLLNSSNHIISVANWVQWQDFPVNITVAAVGDVYIGWEDKWAEGGVSPRMYPAAIDESASQARSWVAANTTGSTPDVVNLGNNEVLSLIDSLGLPGNFMIRGNVTLAPAATPTPLPPRCAGERYTDVCPGDFFYTPVLELSNDNIVSGYNTSPPCDGSSHVPCFKPMNSMTRGQVSKIVANAAGFSEPPTTQTFEDVPPSHTFYLFVERLAVRGLIGGYICGGFGEPCVSGKPYFRVGVNVTRGQLSKITAEAFGYNETPTTQTFQDVPPTHTFYVYVERMAMRNIIGGYPCGGAGEPCMPGNRAYFRVGNDVTRGQTAKIVHLARSTP